MAGPTTRQFQARFFDNHPPLYPWPALLRSAGLNRVCKPREALWKLAFEELDLGPQARVLDVGCGTGMWLDRLRQQFGISGMGIDVSSESVQTAARNSSGELAFLRGDAPCLPFAEGVFDVVISLDVLEHIEDQQRCLHEMLRVLKPGGRLLLWTLNRNQHYTWNWWLDKIGLDIYERAAHDPALLPDVHEVRSELERVGMFVERFELFNAFFTLALDEAIMVTVSLFSRLGLFRSESQLGRSLGRGFLAATDFLSRHLLQLLNWLDQPWITRGYSNGFLLIAHRKV